MGRGLRGRRGVEGVKGADAFRRECAAADRLQPGRGGAGVYDCLGLPHAPAWSPILQMAETLWSTVLIFLFLLALRNQFKIK